MHVVHRRHDHAVDLTGVQLEGVPTRRLPRPGRPERAEEPPLLADVGLGDGHDLGAALGGQTGVGVTPRSGPDHRQLQTLVHRRAHGLIPSCPSRFDMMNVDDLTEDTVRNRLSVNPSNCRIACR